jgi:dihydrofolate synthase/folylpolyglutamate synthase
VSDRAGAHFETLFGPEFGHGKPFDLVALRAALTALGEPQTKLPPIIHVAGTNGKGSTIAFLRAIGEAAGLKIHTFTKPHMLQLRERFCVATENVSDEALIAAADRVKATGADVSQFEAQVAAAFLLFSETPADLALIETGLGGTDDATNVIPAPRVAVITPIDFDHAEVLGPTLEDIAKHKAGIIKEGAIVVSARQTPEPEAVLLRAAWRTDAPLQLGGRDWDAWVKNGRLALQIENRLLDLPEPTLRGPHQADNAALAALAALALDDPRITEDAIGEGVANARWPGRLEPVTRGALAQSANSAGCELWVDGGHNTHAARALAESLHELKKRTPRPVVAIIGMRARKDGAAFMAALSPALTRVIAVPIANEEHIDPEQLVTLAKARGLHAETADGLDDAMQKATRTRDARILVCGSLALAGAVLARSVN